MNYSQRLFLAVAALGLCALSAAFEEKESPKLLIQTAKLAALQATNSNEILLLDLRPKEDYLQGHIPGAVHFDYAMLSEERSGVRGLLKSTDALAQALAEAGIDPGKQIVLIAGMADNVDIKNATRMFWILDYLSYPDVAILDGGFAKWKHEERPVSMETSSAPALTPSALPIAPRPERLVMQEELIALREQGDTALLDLRNQDDYSGASKNEFVARAGHIPGAANVPAASLLEPQEGGAYYVFCAAQELEALLRGVVPESSTRVVTYCNSGRDASVGFFGALLGGQDNIALYDGSMAEWGACAELPVEQGMAAEIKEQ